MWRSGSTTGRFPRFFIAFSFWTRGFCCASWTTRVRFLRPGTIPSTRPRLRRVLVRCRGLRWAVNLVVLTRTTVTTHFFKVSNRILWSTFGISVFQWCAARLIQNFSAFELTKICRIQLAQIFQKIIYVLIRWNATAMLSITDNLRTISFSFSSALRRLF